MDSGIFTTYGTGAEVSHVRRKVHIPVLANPDFATQLVHPLFSLRTFAGASQDAAYTLLGHADQCQTTTDVIAQPTFLSAACRVHPFWRMWRYDLPSAPDTAVPPLPYQPEFTAE